MRGKIPGHSRPSAWMLGVLLVFSGLTAPAGWAQTPELPFPDDPDAGRRTFAEHGCVRCHAIWGNGGTLGPDLGLVGAGRSLQQLAGMFWNHTPRMIEAVRDRGFQWPTLDEKDLTNLISYIYYVKFFDEVGDADQGERWFRDKQCVRCHSVGGEGGGVGRALDSYARYIAPIALAEGMWNNGPAMQAAQMARSVPIPTFQGREIADIQAFIRRESKLAARNVVFFRPPNPNRGRALFRSKGCMSCHGPTGRGTAFGPDLRAAIQQLRVSEIAGKLWNHSFRMSGAMRSRGIAFPNFEGALGSYTAAPSCCGASTRRDPLICPR